MIKISTSKGASYRQRTLVEMLVNKVSPLYVVGIKNKHSRYYGFTMLMRSKQEAKHVYAKTARPAQGQKQLLKISIHSNAQKQKRPRKRSYCYALVYQAFQAQAWTYIAMRRDYTPLKILHDNEKPYRTKHMLKARIVTISIEKVTLSKETANEIQNH